MTLILIVAVLVLSIAMIYTQRMITKILDRLERLEHIQAMLWYTVNGFGISYQIADRPEIWPAPKVEDR